MRQGWPRAGRIPDPPGMGLPARPSPVEVGASPPSRPRSFHPEPTLDPLLEEIRRLQRAARPLDPGTTRRRRLRDGVLATSERFLRRIRTQKGFEEDRGPGSIPGMAIPEQGMALEEALALLEREVVPPGAHPASGAHMAYIPGGGIYHAALGDFLAAVTNKYAGVFVPGPGAVRLENRMVRWTADLVGYPEGAGGSLASGGSLANLTAIVAARDARGVSGPRIATSVVYATEQAHHCIDKALHIAGLAGAPVRRIPVDARYRMRPEALEDAVREDREAGLTPWLLVGNAGATDTGAVDPLDALADVATREGMWYHVDAAYGGFFLLTEYGRGILKGIERSDSTVLDPHKTLFLPWGSGIVLARDVRTLAAAHAWSAHYLQDAPPDPSEVSPSDVSPELSRPFRGLRMWLPLVLAGVGPFRAALEEKLLLARWFHREVAALGFQVGPEPDLSVVTYRWAPAGVPEEEADRMNRTILEGVLRDGRVFLSSTRLDGRFTLRLAAVSFRTHLPEVRTALQVLREQVAALG